MPWPRHIRRAEARRDRAEAALRADTEDTKSGKPYDVKRRNRLVKEFNDAFASFQNEVLRVGKKHGAEKEIKWWDRPELNQLSRGGLAASLLFSIDTSPGILIAYV